MTPPVVDAALARVWLQAGEPALVVAVADTQGSVPREAGTRMLVSARSVAGTVGGGHLEHQAIAMAREALLRTTQPAPFDWPVKLGPTLGQCCGGALTLKFLPLTEGLLGDWPETAPRFRLQLFGAGHVGRAIVHLLAQIPCQVQWMDEREGEFPPDPLPGHIERVCVEPVEAEVALAVPGSSFLVLTHSHDLDLALAEAILRRGDFTWFGLIGSATKRARFRSRLAAKGLPEALLDRMTCPIGLPGITGKAPGVIAASVVAQMLLAHELKRKVFDPDAA